MSYLSQLQKAVAVLESRLIQNDDKYFSIAIRRDFVLMDAMKEAGKSKFNPLMKFKVIKDVINH